MKYYIVISNIKLHYEALYRADAERYAQHLYRSRGIVGDVREVASHQ